MIRSRLTMIICTAVLVALAACAAGLALQNAPRSTDADWPTYNRDLAGTRYSPLTQIDTTNVATLREAWTYRLRPEPGRSVAAVDKPARSLEIFQEVTPIVVNGVMYLPSGNRVVAL